MTRAVSTWVCSLYNGRGLDRVAADHLLRGLHQEVNKMGVNHLYSGFETCFAPPHQRCLGLDSKTHLKSRFCAILKKGGRCNNVCFTVASLPFSCIGTTLASLPLFMHWHHTGTALALHDCTAPMHWHHTGTALLYSTHALVPHWHCTAVQHPCIGIALGLFAISRCAQRRISSVPCIQYARQIAVYPVSSTQDR